MFKCTLVQRRQKFKIVTMLATERRAWANEATKAVPVVDGAGRRDSLIKSRRESDTNSSRAGPSPLSRPGSVYTMQGSVAIESEIEPRSPKRAEITADTKSEKL